MKETLEQWAIAITLGGIFMACWLWLTRRLIRQWNRWRFYRKSRAVIRAALIKSGMDKNVPRLKEF
jgi:hypothetical protein